MKSCRRAQKKIAQLKKVQTVSLEPMVQDEEEEGRGDFLYLRFLNSLNCCCNVVNNLLLLQFTSLDIK